MPQTSTGTLLTGKGCPWLVLGVQTGLLFTPSAVQDELELLMPATQ